MQGTLLLFTKGDKEVYEIERWLPATQAFCDFWIAKL